LSIGLDKSEWRRRILRLRRFGHQESFDGATGSVRAPVLPIKGHLDGVDIVFAPYLFKVRTILKSSLEKV